MHCGVQKLLDQPIERVEPCSTVSSTGTPLSFNRAPSPDLDPWIARIVVVRVDQVANFEIECGACTDLAYQRFLLGGDLEVETADGWRSFRTQPMLVGPHSRLLQVRCTGPMATVGIGFRPGALRKLMDCDMTPMVNRIEGGDPLGLFGEDSAADFMADASPEEWADLIEERIRDHIRRNKPEKPEPISTAFEHASFADPNTSPGAFAQSQGISLRTLERIVRRDFGLTPRTVLRRARALDLAAQLQGIADSGEEDEFLMRYFDQSHCIREFQAFFGMTPQAFRANQRMLLTIGLEARAARRLEELERLEPGERRPWHGGENI